MSSGKASVLEVRRRVPGRRRFPGRPIASSDLAAAMEPFAGAVRQYQFAPGDGRRISVSWTADPSSGERGTTAALTESLHERFPAATFTVRRVPVIDTPGGKSRRFL